MLLILRGLLVGFFVGLSLLSIFIFKSGSVVDSGFSLDVMKILGTMEVVGIFLLFGIVIFFVSNALLQVFKIKKYVVIVVFILEFILICNFFIPIRQAIDKRILRSMDEIGNSM